MLLFFYFSCTGPAGPVGPTGPTGANGANGANGAAGATGPAGQDAATYNDFFEDFSSGIKSPLTTTGDSVWFTAFTSFYNATVKSLADDRAVSGHIYADEVSSLSMNVNMPRSGILYFDAFISSERSFDWLMWSIDGVTLDGISGLGGPFEFHIPLTQGAHTITWEYSKDVSITENDDLSMLDNILITNYSAARLSEPVLPESVTLWSKRPANPIKKKN